MADSPYTTVRPVVATFLYFIQAGEDGPIKIGFARDPKWRLRDLQTAHFAELRLLAVYPGGGDLERELHREFSALRIRGEWFKPSKRILALCDERLGERRLAARGRRLAAPTILTEEA